MADASTQPEGLSAEAQGLEDMTLEQEREAFVEKKKEAKAAAAAAAGKDKQAQQRKAWPPPLDQILVVGVAVAVILAMVFVSRQEQSPETRLFTKEQLSTFDGKEGRPMYLSILGQVFDVTKGDRYYGEGGGYAFFVGRDASRAFVTGDFEGDLSDDVEGLTHEQCASLQEWLSFYKKEYVFKGRLIGAFYTHQGNVTMSLRKVRMGAKQAKTADEQRREQEARFPKCNMRWNDLEGGWVWCEGEDLRPRKIFIQLPGGKPAERCACMEGIGWSDVRQVYPNCAPEATSCQVSPPS